ncbi:MAG TPA: hypothetical protein VF101_16665 [Gaiellaceae bacterium]
MRLETLALIGSAPSVPGGGFWSKGKLALLRALRTFLQGVAAAFPASGAGQAIFDASYWRTLGYSVLAAAITALASFIQNVANFLPDDPTQTPAPAPPAPAPQPGG